MTKYGLMRELYLMRWCPPVICISAMICHSSHPLFHSELLHILRVHVPLCWLLAARISVWVLWEHDKVERAEMTEGVNSIPAAEMAFKCLSLCTPIVLQTHYLRACLCVLVHDCKMCFRAIPPIISPIPRDSPSTFLFWSFSHSSCFPSCPPATGLC